MGRRRSHRDLANLTAREREVFDLIRDGLTNPQIAARLEIGPETVKHHVSEILSKLGSKTREEAAAWTPDERRGASGPGRWAIAAMGAGTMAVTVAGIGLLAWGVSRAGTDDDSEIASIETQTLDCRNSFNASDRNCAPTVSASPTTSADEWRVVAPEDRTDIQMIDITEARLALPTSADAADCEEGDLDPVKAEGLIRDWLSTHRTELARTLVWDETLILVTCVYPSQEFDGKLALYIGIPRGGYSYVAPESCQDEMRSQPQDATTIPAECIPPTDLEVPLELDRHTIILNPGDVLK